MENGDTNTHARGRSQGDATEHVSVIARLNDGFRTGLTAGRWLVTHGIMALGPADMAAVLARVRSFSAFTSDNDPYDEHDFGSIEHGGQRVFWKIDCYDTQLEFGSPDPADPDVTTRVLTVMLASEY